MELRSLLQRYVPDQNSVRVIGRNGDDLIGHLKDLNQKGFRLNAKKKFHPGDVLEGLMEYDQEGVNTRMIPFSARCVWAESKEYGFSIKEIPMAQEAMLDDFINQLSAKA